MKAIITLLVAIVMSSCNSNIDYRITGKSYTNYWGQNTLPLGICQFYYDGSHSWTEDSCNKYNVGDTVKH